MTNVARAKKGKVLQVFTDVYRYNKKKKADALRQRRHYAKKRNRVFNEETGYEELPENYSYTHGRPPTAYKMLIASQNSAATSKSCTDVALLDNVLHNTKYDKCSRVELIFEIESLKKKVDSLVSST